MRTQSSSIISTRIPMIWKILLLIEIIIWIPLVFLGFDSHHDGLILTTVSMLQDSIRNKGEWPFNQYGPFWALPFTLITYALPSEWVFTVIRFMTVAFYLLTGFLIYQCAKVISTLRIAFISILIFFLSQPFVTNFGSSLVPWPSAVIMPMFTLVTLLLLYINVQPKTSKQIKNFSFIIGVLVSGIFFSRAQIGFLLFFVVLILLYFNQRKSTVILFVVGFLSFTSVLFIFLNYFGWLFDALSDEFIFGSLYFRGDTSTYPSPIFTLIGIIFFILLLNYGRQTLNLSILKFSQKQIIIFSIGLLSLIFIGMISILNFRNLDILAILATIVRRFWISYFLAVIIFAVFSHLRKIHSAHKSHFPQDSSLNNRSILILLSLVGELQIYPLFDQMHFWWGSTPAVILTVIITKERLFNDITSKLYRKFMINLFMILMTFLGLIQMTAQLLEPHARFPQQSVKYLWVSPTVSAEQVRLQEFFGVHIPKGSSVLNLCANSDVFFMNKSVSSSTRIFVLWPNITQIESMKRSMISSKPDLVLTCSLTRIPSLEKNSEIEQRGILFESLDNPKIFATLESSGSTKWNLWKNY